MIIFFTLLPLLLKITPYPLPLPSHCTSALPCWTAISLGFTCLWTCISSICSSRLLLWIFGLWTQHSWPGKDPHWLLSLFLYPRRDRVCSAEEGDCFAWINIQVPSYYFRVVGWLYGQWFLLLAVVLPSFLLLRIFELLYFHKPIRRIEKTIPLLHEKFPLSNILLRLVNLQLRFLLTYSYFWFKQPCWHYFPEFAIVHGVLTQNGQIEGTGFILCVC